MKQPILKAISQSQIERPSTIGKVMQYNTTSKFFEILNFHVIFFIKMPKKFQTEASITKLHYS